LPALAGMIATMTVHADRIAAAAPVGYTLATEVADWLVRRGIPFREAHEITGALVARASTRGIGLDEIEDAELADVSVFLTPDVRAVLTVPGALAARTTYGSTGHDPVTEQLTSAAQQIAHWRAWSDEVVVPR